MDRTPATLSLPGLSITGVFLALVLLLGGCGGDSSTGIPTVAGTATATQAVPTAQPATPAATAIPATDSPSPTAGATTAPTVDPDLPLKLELLSPEDGTGVEVDTIRVFGKTRIDAIVDINGDLVEVSVDGSFEHDFNLETGANLVEVVASTITGEAASQDAAVFFISTAAGLPFTLFYPPDGLVVSDPDVLVVGGTSPEAVVGVDGIPVATNSQGIFSTALNLEEGGNFIEVLATDIDGNVRFQTVAVFYLP